LPNSVSKTAKGRRAFSMKHHCRFSTRCRRSVPCQDFWYASI
jgi:hypothetical protein